MRRIHTTLAMLTVMGTVFSAPALATVVDFQDVPSGACDFSGPSVTSRGYGFTGNPSDPNLYVCDAGTNGNNTSAALINANSQSILFMTQTGGGAFSLDSFFAGGRTADFDTSVPNPIYGIADTLTVVGNLSGGGTVTAVFALDTATFAFQQYSLPATFVDLSSVSFTSTGPGANPEFLIDDIVVNSAQVPAPPTVLLLLGPALIALGRRRRN